MLYMLAVFRWHKLACHSTRWAEITAMTAACVMGQHASWPTHAANCWTCVVRLAQSQRSTSTTLLPSACYTTAAHAAESGGHMVSMSEVLRRRIRRNSDVKTAAPSSLSSASPPSAHSTTSVCSATSPQQRQWSQWCGRVHGASLNIYKWLCNALPVF